jgi:hypothetical protein
VCRCVGARGLEKRMMPLGSSNWGGLELPTTRSMSEDHKISISEKYHLSINFLHILKTKFMVVWLCGANVIQPLVSECIVNK